MDEQKKNAMKEADIDTSQAQAKTFSKKKDDQPSQEESNPKGAHLKEVRLQKGIPLETVHEETKIPMDALRAIEEGYTVRTLTPFYIKGFLKIYAKYLDVDIEEVVDGYKKEKLPKQIKLDNYSYDFGQRISNLFTRQQKQRIVLIVGFVLTLFVVFKVTTFLVRIFSKNNDQETIENVKLSNDLQSASKTTKTQDTAQTTAKKDPIESIKVVKKQPPTVTEKTQTSVKQSSAAPKTSSTKKVVVRTQPVEAKRAPKSNVQTSIIAEKDVTLTVRAQKDSWLRVKVDGKIVFQSTLRKGSVETWMADKTVEITGKNIYLLEFELNGTMIGTLGKKDRRAKGIIVTKDGLTVKK